MKNSRPLLYWVWVWMVALSLSFESQSFAGRSLALIPSRMHLEGPAGRQMILVEQMDGKKHVGQASDSIHWTSSNSKVFKIEDGFAVPVGNGTATLTVKIGKETLRAPVKVTGMDQPFEWSFRNHVQPVLAKTGCSSGACHGAAAGQNGFKLSLRGYDDEGDFKSITRQALGRRIVPSDPGRSLLLLKPTGAVPHKGGKKFEPESLEYRVISEWIAAGTPGPKESDARIQRLEILPDHVTLKTGQEQQLIVRAHYSDGKVEDVTRWVKYTDANAAVTTIDQDGKINVVGHGEGAITAWYLSRIAIATVSVPFQQEVDPKLFTKAPRKNFVDDLVLAKLKTLNLPPSPRCTDEEFIRRLYLDTLGILPTSDEVRKFLSSSQPSKRDELIDAILRRPEFVDYWAYKWSDLLLVNSEKLKAPAMWAYYTWIRNNVAANTPWDVFVQRIITAKGSTLQNGAANFYTLHEDPADMAETTSVAFMGMSINCAKCHNHPMEKWTNDEYYGFANLFARVRAKNLPEEGNRLVFASSEGDLVQPLRGKPQPPRPLEGKAVAATITDRREALAAWLTSPSNGYFTRAVVNRVWANFLGVGLVENVDDLRDTNPATNEELLRALSQHLVTQKYDLKALMRSILQSETYQRSSAPLKQNAGDTRFYSRYYPRRMMAEVLLDSLAQATGAPTQFPDYPVGWRALQLPDSNVKSYFLKSFGRPERFKTCECERTEEPNVTQVLHIANGDTVNAKLKAKGNRIDDLLAKKIPMEEMVDEIYLSALSRNPSAGEKEKILKLLQESKEEPRVLLEDLFWGVLSTKEFLFHH